MQKLFALAAVCLYFSFPAQAVVVDLKGKPLPEVVQIFRLFKKTLSSAHSLPEKKLQTVLQTPESVSIEELTALSQEKFLRPKAAERMDPISIQHYQQLLGTLSAGEKKELKKLFQKLGDVDPVLPQQKEFDYVLINGSTVPNMRTRIMFLASAVQEGTIRLKPTTQIVFLEGERPLFKTETPEVLTNPAPYPKRLGWKAPAILPTDERDAAVMVWDQLDLPTELRNHTPVFVHAEKKPNAQRAETEDCVQKWAKKFSPQPGTALVVSSNPFVYYQLLVTEVLFAKAGLGNMKLDAIGSESSYQAESLDVELGLMLDNLARTFYYLLKKKS